MVACEDKIILQVPVGVSVEFVRDPVEDVLSIHLRKPPQPSHGEGGADVEQQLHAGSIRKCDTAPQELAADVLDIDRRKVHVRDEVEFVVIHERDWGPFLIDELERLAARGVRRKSVVVGNPVTNPGQSAPCQEEVA